MHIVPTNMTVADYCAGMQAGDLKVNRDYQRSNQIWPETAKSFLIETILHGYPLPKLSLYQITDRISRKTVKEIIDGQQRSEAILQFYDGTLRLSRQLELGDAANRTYAELDPELQDKFLAYSIGIDLFVEATREDVREVFRRINSHTVPLNPEEQRHAQYQGDFKWYIYHLARAHDQTLVDLGVFSEKQIVRMNDMKLFTELTHALIHGITTTNKKSLDSLYREFDRGFDQSEIHRQLLDWAIGTINTLQAVAGTALMKPYNLYSLALAIIHAEHHQETLADLGPGGQGLGGLPTISVRLSELAEAAESKTPRRTEDQPFVDATQSRTNVKSQRETRFRYFLEAVARA